MNQTELRGTTRLAIIGLILLLAFFVVPPLVTGNARIVSLQKGSTFGGQISQYLGIPSDQSDLAKEGKDFSIDKSTYFANKAWVLVHFKALTERVGEGGYAIFQKQDGVYNMVLSPSTTFMSTYLTDLPHDLVAHLYTEGLVYEPGF
jgi:hypothetical protein